MANQVKYFGGNPKITNFMNIEMYDKNKLLRILNAYRSINNKII